MANQGIDHFKTCSVYLTSNMPISDVLLNNLSVDDLGRLLSLNQLNDNTIGSNLNVEKTPEQLRIEAVAKFNSCQIGIILAQKLRERIENKQYKSPQEQKDLTYIKSNLAKLLDDKPKFEKDLSKLEAAK